MSKQTRLPFSPSAGYVAAKDFRFAGRSFADGDPFLWRQMSCPVRRLRQLYEGRFVRMIGGGPVPSPIVTGNPIIDPTRPWEGPIGSSNENHSEEGQLIFDPEFHVIENPERGTWLMTSEEGLAVRLMADEAKRLRKVRQPTPIDPRAIIGG